MDKAPDGSLAAAASSEPSGLRVVQPPAAPEPGIEQLDPNTVRLHWGGPEGAAYAVQLAGDLAFANVVQSIEVAAPAAELKLPSACETYYVRVRTVDARGWPSAYSAPRVINARQPVCLSNQQPLQSSDGRPVLRGAP